MFLRSQTTRCPDLRTETNYSYKEFLHIVTQLAVNLSDTLNSGQRLALLLMQQSLLVTAVMLLRHTCAFSGCLESLGDCRYTCRAWRTCWENHQVTGAKVIVRSFMRTQGADFFFFLGRGGQVEGVSFWCWMKLDDRGSRGETQLQKPLGLRKMSHPLAMNGQLHLLNTLGARAKKARPRSEGCRGDSTSSHPASFTAKAK